MCSASKSVVKAVIGVIRKVWNVIRKYVAYIAFFVILFFPYLWPMIEAYLPTAIATTLSSFASGTFLVANTLTALAWRGVVGLAIASLLSSEAGAEIAERAAKVVGSTAAAAAAVAGAAAGGALEGLTGLSTGSLLALAGGGFLLYLYLTRDRSAETEERDTVVQARKPDKSQVTTSEAIQRGGDYGFAW